MKNLFIFRAFKSALSRFCIYKPAFSLVEMLMALLVASLLLAALAPVMTRRMADHELKVISEASNYDKDMVVSVFNKDTDFNIPSDANQVRITMMGGGGKGGDAFFESREIISTQEFTVPDNVNKLRVFMIGAGGGGASGGAGYGTAYGNIGGTAGQQEYAGSSAANTGVKTWNIPSSAKGNVPEPDARCAQSGVDKWTLASDATKVLKSGDTVVDVKACGGGGGGSAYGQGGGSGGYFNKKVIIPSSFNLISITIGGGGGGGGAQNASGRGANGAGWGGGAGGSESTGTNLVYAAGVTPGGNGGSYYTDCKAPATYRFPTDATGVYSKVIDKIMVTAGSGNSEPLLCSGTDSAATTSGHGSLEGGGGGGGGSTCGGGGGGGGATFFGSYANSETTDKDFFLVAPGGGGGGGGYTQCHVSGGGGGGAGGGDGGGGRYSEIPNAGKAATGGNIGAILNKGENAQSPPSTSGAGGASPIGNPNYCAGGKIGSWTTPGASGKNGYMLISWAPAVDALKCNYSMPSNGGGGGGAGQVWIGELTVTPGQKLTFNIGKGGAQQTLPGADGNNGTATSITSNSSVLISVSGGEGGKYKSEDTYIENSGGLGGGLKFTSSGSAKYVNWKKANLHNGGTSGLRGYLESEAQNGAGGNGGFVYNLKGELLQGGLAGGTNADGNNSPSTSYGSGGGGGGAGTNGAFGIGGKGSNGYIYIEWGGSNGSGGTVGEFTKTTITNLDPDPTKRTMKIRIGRGGGITSPSTEDDPDLFDSSSLGSNGNGGETSISIISGNKTVTHKARGGPKGNDGTMDMGIHGDETKIPSNFSETYKEYIQPNTTTAINSSITSGQKGEDNYGGMGGYLSCLYQTKDEEGNSICTSTIKSNDGTSIIIGPIRPGCGGTSILSPMYESICNISNQTPSPHGNNGLYGAGGGGGAVLNQTGGNGGNGGNGFVILEYKSTVLD